jgi:hypothetical protein
MVVNPEEESRNRARNERKYIGLIDDEADQAKIMI